MKAERSQSTKTNRLRFGISGLGFLCWTAVFNSCQPVSIGSVQKAKPTSLAQSSASPPRMARRSDAFVPPQIGANMRLAMLNEALDLTMDKPTNKAILSEPQGYAESLAHIQLKNSPQAALHFFQRMSKPSAQMRDIGVLNPVFVSRLPQNIDQIRYMPDKKELYYQIMLPLLLRTNQKILEERAYIESLDEQGLISFSHDERLLEIAKSYKVNAEDQNIDELLTRVQPIPIDLMLAQSIEESGWGTSRISLYGNALFGERIWDEEGIIPVKRDAGEKFSVKTFNNLQASIESYAKNLNSHHAYSAFRKARQTLRMDGETITGLKLSPYLMAYSTRRRAYIENINRVITSNKLYEFNDLRFAPDSIEYFIDFPRFIYTAWHHRDFKNNSQYGYG